MERSRTLKATTRGRGDIRRSGPAEADPIPASANNLTTAFTRPIVIALIAVAVVVTGTTFAISEGKGKLNGIVKFLCML